MMDGLTEIVKMVEMKIKKDAINKAALEHTLFWFNIHISTSSYSKKVREGIELSDSESADLEALCYSGMEFNAEQINQLMTDGVIVNEREYGKKCQEVTTLFYEKLNNFLKCPLN